MYYMVKVIEMIESQRDPNRPPIGKIQIDEQHCLETINLEVNLIMLIFEA